MSEEPKKERVNSKEKVEVASKYVLNHVLLSFHKEMTWPFKFNKALDQSNGLSLYDCSDCTICATAVNPGPRSLRCGESMNYQDQLIKHLGLAQYIDKRHGVGGNLICKLC